MLFTEHPFLERFSHARAAGFEAVEFLFPYEYDTTAIAAELRRNNLHTGPLQPSGRQFRRWRSRHGE